MQGFVASQYIVALMYANGSGTSKDLTKALKWLNMAAVAGYGQAMTTLARWHHQGVLGEKNLIVAYIWFDLAGEHGQNNAHQLRDGAASQLSQSDIIKAKEIAKNWCKGQAITTDK
jgi:TPR repeat protein